MLFDSFKVAIDSKHVRLYAEMLVQFNNAQNESIPFGTPKGWDELILHCVEIERYNIYYICANTLPKEKVNRIADYKKIWGLLGLQQGIFTGEYMNKTGKVYFGIAQEDCEVPLSSEISAMILLIRKENNFNGEDVFKIFKEHQYIFGEKSDGSDQVLIQVSELFEDSILLKYECMSQVSLDVYGGNVGRLFLNINLDRYNKNYDESVWRRPCS